MNVYKYIATNGQTTFSGAAAVGGTMSYTSGNIIVFVNGVSLDSTDYTATNGTSVVLAVAARVSDEVVVVAFKSFTVADTYTQSAADARFLSSSNGSVTQAKLAANVAGNGPAFSAYQSTAQSLSAGTNTKITFTTEDFDTANCFSSSRFTPTVAGYYLFTCGTRVDANINALQVKLVHSSIGEFAGGSFTNATLAAFMSSCTGLAYMNGTTDYVEVYAFSGSSITLSASRAATYFQGALVRAA
jgi:hypothetical protein